MSLLEVMKLAGEYDSNLLDADQRFNHSVLLVHQDGSIFLTNNAFLMRHEEWVIVFSKDHVYQPFLQRDLISFGEYIQKLSPIERLL